MRRRAYDALNVLEAIGMISKTKKAIRWQGWPQVGLEFRVGVGAPRGLLALAGTCWLLPAPAGWLSPALAGFEDVP